MKEITILDAQKILTREKGIIIDVRSEKEFEEMHIKGSINVPLDKINQIENIATQSSKTLIFVCKSGVRSKAACKELDQANKNIFYLNSSFENLGDDNTIVKGEKMEAI